MIEFIKTMINLPKYISQLENKRLIMIGLYDLQQHKIEDLESRMSDLEGGRVTE